MATHQHPVRGRLNAFLLDRLEGFMDRVYGGRKRAIFGGLPARVVEIGPGPGANLRYYAPGTTVIAVEPNPRMHPALRENAARYGLKLEIRGVGGERLDIATASVGVVVGTLVLCTVGNPRQVVSEIYRILKPGGRYLFLEHVAAPPGSGLRRLQGILQTPWKWLFEGCHLNRDTHRVLGEAGFRRIEMDCFMLPSAVMPFTPHIFGMALK
jgi:SAM-dependent methyltransferase